MNNIHIVKLSSNFPSNTIKSHLLHSSNITNKNNKNNLLFNIYGSQLGDQSNTIIQEIINNNNSNNNNQQENKNRYYEKGYVIFYLIKNNTNNGDGDGDGDGDEKIIFGILTKNVIEKFVKRYGEYIDKKFVKMIAKMMNGEMIEKVKIKHENGKSEIVRKFRSNDLKVLYLDVKLEDDDEKLCKVYGFYEIKLMNVKLSICVNIERGVLRIYNLNRPNCGYKNFIPMLIQGLINDINKFEIEKRGILDSKKDLKFDDYVFYKFERILRNVLVKKNEEALQLTERYTQIHDTIEALYNAKYDGTVHGNYANINGDGVMMDFIELCDIARICKQGFIVFFHNKKMTHNWQSIIYACDQVYASAHLLYHELNKVKEKDRVLFRNFLKLCVRKRHKLPFKMEYCLKCFLGCKRFVYVLGILDCYDDDFEDKLLYRSHLRADSNIRLYTKERDNNTYVVEGIAGVLGMDYVKKLYVNGIKLENEKLRVRIKEIFRNCKNEVIDNCLKIYLKIGDLPIELENKFKREIVSKEQFLLKIFDGLPLKIGHINDINKIIVKNFSIKKNVVDFNNFCERFGIISRADIQKGYFTVDDSPELLKKVEDYLFKNGIDHEHVVSSTFNYFRKLYNLYTTKEYAFLSNNFHEDQFHPLDHFLNCRSKMTCLKIVQCKRAVEELGFEFRITIIPRHYPEKMEMDNSFG